MKKWRPILLLLALAAIVFFVFHRPGYTQTDGPFVLQQNHPNPFNTITTIDVVVREAGHIKMLVYNLLGKEIQVLTDEDYEVGDLHLPFFANALPSGQYTYTLYFTSKTTSAKQTRKMYLVR